jgi:adenylate cyclase
MDAPVAHDVFLFGGFRLDRHSGGLFRRDGSGCAVPVTIGSRALDVLAVLVAHPGELVSKQAIMQAVWPGITVDEKNLTVQISTLRRMLDDGQTERSCVQTEAGRGYRFVLPVTRLPNDGEAVSRPVSPDEEAAVPAASKPEPGSAASASRRTRHRWARPTLLALAVLTVTAGLDAAWLLRGPASIIDVAQRPTAPASAVETPSPVPAPAPRLSIVVLPFRDMDDDPTDDYLADAITDDLTTDLSRIAGAFVVARESAYAYKGKATDVRQIGRELGVRYVLEGSVRRIDAVLRVNVQLISAETGAHLWSDRFDEEIGQLAAGQQQIIARMYDTIGNSLEEIESARSQRERPTSPDALDLILRARSREHLPQTPQQDKETLALYERALALDPQSVPALTGVAYYLIDGRPGGSWGDFENMQRAGRLLAQARSLALGSAKVLNVTLYWLRTLGRCAEVIEAAERAIRIDPNRMRTQTGIYNELAVCKTRTGHAEEELALQIQADQLNPRSPWKDSRYRHMGFAALMLGRYQDAIGFLQRSLAINPEAGLPWSYRMLAAAHARTGQIDEAKRWLAASVRLWPYGTVRAVYPEELSSPVYVRQMADHQAALSLAGARDHADEDADFGVPVDGSLHSEVAGRTPKDAPGARTIRTADLVLLLADAKPLVIDTVSNSWGRSIPGAVGLRFSGLGGSFADEAQDRLRGKMAELTAGDLQRPVVAVGWNSERFDGRNLALRLVALGYTQVHWYRGGREAWEVAEQPETELAVQEW